MIGALDPREREGIHRDLESPDDEVRRLAIERLVALPADEALQPLLARLGDDAWRVRKAVIERLVAAPVAWNVPPALVEALADADNSGRRNAAVEALVRCGRRSVPALLDATECADVDVRKLVVDALAGIGDPAALPRLVGLLEDPDPNVRAAAADALGAVGGPDAAEALLGPAVCGDEETLVRLAALRGLASLEAPLCVRQLADAVDDPLLRPAAFDVLGRAEDPEAEAVLLKGLQGDSRAAREAAMEALLRLVAGAESDAADALVEAIRAAARQSPKLHADAFERLVQADLGTRLALVQFLGLVGDERVVRPLLLAARDEALTEVVLGALAALGGVAENVVFREFDRLDDETRVLACDLLARTHGREGRSLLLDALDAPSAELRAAAARALGRRGEAEAVPSLLRRLEVSASGSTLGEAEEREKLEQALLSLAGSGDTSASESRAVLVERLVDRLGEAEGATREALARVLAGVSGAAERALLDDLLQDPSEAIREAGARARVRIEPDARAEPLRLALADESARVRAAAAAGLGGCQSAQALDDLERLLDDEDVRVRAAVAHALGERLGAVARGAEADETRARILALLERALQEGGCVALTALEGMQAARAPETVELVRELLHHDDLELVQGAIRCLGAADDLAALSEIVPLVGHPSWSVRAEALQVLADRGVRRSVPSILRRLEIEQDTYVREVILHALARLEA